jgi:2-phospho-L-lactate guanylyltransferase
MRPVNPEPIADLQRLHALVPLRSLAGGKARLGGAIDAEERETLLRGLLIQTLDVLRSWAPCRAVHLVTRDLDVLKSVARLEIDAGPADQGVPPQAPLRAILEEGEGLNSALTAARDDARAEGATAVLMLPVDLPLLSRDALDVLLEAADAAVAAGSGRPIVVVAPSDARGGTNALLLSPPIVIEPSFGIASLEAHLRAAARAGASLQVVHSPQLGFDLDTPEDLERLDPQRLGALASLGAVPLAARRG